jgi:HTH-type transcriptional regulator/antitoxin MqsA
MKKCPVCKKGTLERKKIKETYTYKGQSIDIEQAGAWCDRCNDGILSSADIKTTERILHDFRANIDGFLVSDEVRRIRKKLGLTQHQAAELCGGGPNAFGRYERGEALQMRATDSLLRLLGKHPELLDDLIQAEAA